MSARRDLGSAPASDASVVVDGSDLPGDMTPTPAEEDAGAASDDGGTPGEDGGDPDSGSSPTGCDYRREGFGADTRGGDGGTLYEVTDFASLEAAIGASGARIVRQTTTTPIEVTRPLDVEEPFVTLEDLVLYNADSIEDHTLAIRTHDVIVTNGRFYNPVETQHDVITIGKNGQPVYNVLVERSTIMFGSDESVNTWYETYDVTFAWNIIAYPLNWDGHGYGPLFGSAQGGGRDISFHHNLITTSRYRNPKANILGTFQMWNNLIYNCGDHTQTLLEPAVSGAFQAVLEGNYFESGPDTRTDNAISAREHGGLYVSRNVMDGRNLAWGDVDVRGSVRQLSAIPAGLPASTVTDASVAREDVLRCSGAHPERRTPLETTVIRDVRDGGSQVPSGQTWIEHASDVGFAP